MKYLFLIFIMLFSKTKLYGYTLLIHDDYVNSILEWFDSLDPSVSDSFLKMPECQLMELLYLKNTEDEKPISFSDILADFETGGCDEYDPYGLKKAYENRQELLDLITAIRTLNCDDLIMKDLMLFPRLKASGHQYEIFYTVTGWKWGDAIQFNYRTIDDQVVLEDKGHPAIIFNLGVINSTYGNNIESKLNTFSMVFVHEMFHTLFSIYRENNDVYTHPVDNLRHDFLMILMDEGIAHYQSMEDMFDEKYESLIDKENAAFISLNSRIQKLSQSDLSISQKRDILSKGTYGSFWDKDICIVGMFMAYHIEHEFGIEALQKCIQNGLDAFLDTYEKCRDSKPLIFPITFHY